MGIALSDYHAMEARLEKNARGSHDRAKADLYHEPVNVTPGLPLTITIIGQIKGGKNNMVVTRAGLHFPKKDWAAWRNRTVAEIKAQLPPGWVPLSNPCSLTLEYVAGDLRRRDQPAIIDSIFHCLEKAGVVTDDTLLWVTESSRRHDKKNPMARLEFYQP